MGWAVRFELIIETWRLDLAFGCVIIFHSGGAIKWF